MTVDHRQRSRWLLTFDTGPDCVPLQQLDQPLAGSDRQHVDGCARCQTERALWRQFSRPAPASDEGAAVEWVVVALRRRFSAAAGATVPAPFPGPGAGVYDPARNDFACSPSKNGA